MRSGFASSRMAQSKSAARITSYSTSRERMPACSHCKRRLTCSWVEAVLYRSRCIELQLGRLMQKQKGYPPLDFSACRLRQTLTRFAGENACATTKITGLPSVVGQASACQRGFRSLLRRVYMAGGTMAARRSSAPIAPRLQCTACHPPRRRWANSRCVRRSGNARDVCPCVRRAR